MLKTLLQLWRLRKRRNFRKRELALAIYIVFLYVCFGAGAYAGAKANGDSITATNLPPAVGLLFVMAMLIPDIFPKLIMKSGDTFMDDYLKTRPIKEKTWNVFILLTNALSIWCYLTPVIFLPILILFLDTWQALACFAIMLLFSYANSLFVTCIRKTSDHFLHFAIIGGWIVMFMTTSALLMLSLWMPTWLLDLEFMLLATAVIAGLVAFMVNESNYKENSHKPSRLYSKGRVTLFNMQFWGIARAKRLRQMVFLVSTIMLVDCYLMAWVSDPADLNAVIYAIMCILLPSLALSQLTFSVEANFFQGLTTKPITTGQLLTNCYYFYILLSAVATVFIVPLLFIKDNFNVPMLLGALCLSVFINLFNLPTCLFSSRLELFSQSFFNMQGANIRINFYSIALLVPLGISAGIWALFDVNAWVITSITLGTASLMAHKPVITWIAAKFDERRYARMEDFMK